MARKDGVSEETIALICEHTSTGVSLGRIAAIVGISRNAVSGIIYRLRQAGDPRISAAGAGSIIPVETQQDRLAEAFAAGAATLGEAARAAGLSLPKAGERWTAIVAGLGWQAR